MKKDKKQLKPVIFKRELKIENIPNSKKDYKEVDSFLATLSKKFMRDPLSLEKLDKEYYELIDKKKQNQAGEEHRHKNKRRDEKAIFYDIFIKPKETKIEDIKRKRLLEKQAKEMEGSLDIRIDGNAAIDSKGALNFSSKVKEFMGKIKHTQNKQSIEDIFAETNRELGIDSKMLFNYLSQKFIPNHNEQSKGNFFNQLIQIKPPEGINAIVASPLLECKIKFIVSKGMGAVDSFNADHQDENHLK